MVLVADTGDDIHVDHVLAGILSCGLQDTVTLAAAAICCRNAGIKCVSGRRSFHAVLAVERSHQGTAHKDQ